MTLEEAIQHCYENSEKEKCNGHILCSDEYIQLAHWLEELKEWRKRYEEIKNNSYSVPSQEA